MHLIRRYRLEPQIIRAYALLSAALFSVLAAYYLIDLPESGLAKAMHLMQVKAYSMFILALVLGSTVVGMVYHHLHERITSRNTFAFVFSASVLKLLAGIVALIIF
ncbi:MAG: hypothetical protein OEM26_02375 [Saprospiraceae bacterium]|jgi:hypothetical protein|nr:hypothetical protein [Saprospiraceae bacterium]